jgi:hypothetical protein
MWKIDGGNKAGTTTDSYVNAIDWITAQLGRKTILLKNTHVSYSMKYKLSGCASENGITKELVAETVLLPGETAEFHYDRQWHRLVLQVVDGTGHADYQIDYEGQGA